MKILIALACSAVLLSSCGDSKSELKEGEVAAIPMNSAKEKISYLLGAEQAQNLVKDPNFDKYIKTEILKGFSEGLANPESFDMECQKSIQSLLGPNFDEFNSQYNKEASLSIGKFVGSTFKRSWEQAKSYDQIDTKFLKYGFELGMNKADTLISEQEKTQMMTAFMEKVNGKIMGEVQQTESIFFAKVKQIAGIKEVTQGIYLETIKAGKGKSPIVTDDVKANYVLMNVDGDTIESSLGSPTVPVFNLSQVIPGWTIGIPNMKTGGKYKLYVPQDMAYGKNPPSPSIPPFATLVFYVELLDCGPQGTIK